MFSLRGFDIPIKGMNYSHHGNIVFAWSKQDIPAWECMLSQRLTIACFVCRDKVEG